MRYVRVCSFCLRNATLVQTIIGRKKKKKKKKVSFPVFHCRPQYFFSSYRKKKTTKKKKKKKKNNIPMPGPRRVITFFCCFFISKSSVFSVCQREYVTGRHGQRSRPAVAHFAEELQNPFSNPYVDFMGLLIPHRTMIHNSGAFSLPVLSTKIYVKIPRKCSRPTLAPHERNRVFVTVTSREIVTETVWREKHTYVR